ncbi:hypothetical protein CkaCkLH20_07649 [Colletotrichum karsti]|uniref:F-box domain-containing protein n=1 Tax=Colletotrichum karsti TaxID=1095194 RepID=A0A9P6I344_9PEZI|nr:uncharacterized protein CkaCkLH20_07649 [Colletotrichum karsti]KAF9874955.1 hypothetical protein CkaCkLH20_07649 [Colletotrichum karsti]
MSSITDLTERLLEKIVKLLCSHCHPPPPSQTYWGMYCNDSCPIGKPEHGRRMALANLCLTNKRLNSAATPILYHRFHRRDEIAFAKTLFKWRPDLAQHVRSLHLGADDELTFGQSKDGELVLREITNQLHHLRISQNDEGKEEDGPMLLSLLIGRCTNIEDLCLTVSWDGNPVPFCPPGSLPKLETLSLSHWDDEGGFDLAFATEIFLAAPNITSIFAYAVTEVGGGLKMANVTEVTLRNSFLQADAFNRLLRQLPSLEKLTYYVGDAIMDGEAPPRARDMQDAILEHAPRLKFLKLLMLEDDNEYRRSDGIVDEDMMRSLRGLKQLQELRLDAQYLVVPRYEEDETDMGPRTLVDILPHSIQLVGIECGDYTCSTRTLLPAILGLGKVCKVEFPHLRSFRVSGLDGLEEAREIFESSGVEFITEYV